MDPARPQRRSSRDARNVRQHFEGRRLLEHLWCDAREHLNGMRDATFGIDQCRPFACEAAAIDFDEADFDDAIVEEAAAGRLEVEKYYAFVKHRDDLSVNGAPRNSRDVTERSRSLARCLPRYGGRRAPSPAAGG